MPSGQLTVWISTQGPHGVRSLFARALGIDDSQVRVIMPDVGGSFGLKMYPCREELAVVLASRQLRGPVKWIQDRRENLMCDDHAREDMATVTFAADDDGLVLGAKVEFLESAGAFPAAMGSAAVSLRDGVPRSVPDSRARRVGADRAHEHARGGGRTGARGCSRRSRASR